MLLVNWILSLLAAYVHTHVQRFMATSPCSLPPDAGDLPGLMVVEFAHTPIGPITCIRVDCKGKGQVQ